MRLSIHTSVVCFFVSGTLPVFADEPISTSPGLAELSQMLGSLALVVVAIFIASAVIRHFRFGRRGSDNALQVVSVINLGSKEKLVLVTAGEEQILVGLSAAGMQRLHTLTKPAQALPADNTAFTGALKAVHRKVQNAD